MVTYTADFNVHPLNLERVLDEIELAGKLKFNASFGTLELRGFLGLPYPNPEHIKAKRDRHLSNKFGSRKIKLRDAILTRKQFYLYWKADESYYWIPPKVALLDIMKNKYNGQLTTAGRHFEKVMIATRSSLGAKDRSSVEAAIKQVNLNKIIL